MLDLIKYAKKTPLGGILKFFYYYVVDRRLKGKNYEIKARNSKFYLPYIRTDEIQKTIFKEKDYMESDTLDKICKEWRDGIIEKTMKNSVVLDIGANIGNHTLYFLNECNAQFVYCFEPADDTFQILTNNIIINHLEDRVQLMHVGVGSVSGNARIKQQRQHDTGYTQLEKSETGDITIVAIDDLDIRKNIGFIKIDVEGFELEVIKGLENTLKKDKPLIMIEVWNQNSEEIMSILNGIGYHSDILDRREMNTDYLFY